MNRTDEITQAQSPKICKLAIASLLAVVTGFLAGCVLCSFEHIKILSDLAISSFVVSSVAGLVLGIIACWKIHKSKGALKGYVFSISGAVFAVIIMIIIILSAPTTC